MNRFHPVISKTILNTIVIFLLSTSPTLFAQLKLPSGGNVQSKLVSEVRSIQAGETFHIGLYQKMDSGWHTYYKDPGDSGMPTSLNLNLPDGFTAGDLQWPKPWKLIQGPLVSNVYEEEVLLILPITAANNIQPGEEVTISGMAEWLECAEICVPGSGKVTLTLNVTAQEPQKNKTWAALFATTRAEISTGDAIAYKGTLVQGEDGVIRKQPHAATQAQATSLEAKENRSMPYYLWMAFIGGFILNLMPCVFPVIGIKILGFAQLAGGERKKIMQHGISFSLGVLSLFWILAILLLSFKSAGKNVGWGFQMQEPVFVIGLGILFLLMALNFSGLFDIGGKWMSAGQSLASKHSLSGSFFSGALATVAATPCSAPFLGVALGATLILSEAEILLIFTFIGLGLSSPYLLFSIAPSLAQKLPKPGAWMETFKQILAFPLYATVAFLVWILAAQISSEALLFCLMGLVTLALAAWVYGAAQRKRSKVLSIAALLIFILSLFITFKEGKTVEWDTWSEAKVAQLQNENKAIFIDFTARWCATCQLNKLNLFTSDALLQALKEKNVVLLKADWTNHDPKITEALKKYGRSAVPTNIIYLPGNKEPIILPELLSPNIVLKHLEGF